MRLELQQARKLDVQLESALKARSEADERMKDFSRRKQEAEEKLRKVEERQKKASEEWDKLTSWRERYRSKEGIAEQLSALLIHLDTCLTARRAVERSDKALLAIRQKIQRLEVRRQSLRREAETHAKEQVKIEEERKSVALALQRHGNRRLWDRSIEDLPPYGTGVGLLLEQAQYPVTTWRYQKPAGQADLPNALPCPAEALSILSPLTRRMSACWPCGSHLGSYPAPQAAFSTGRARPGVPAGNNSPPCYQKNWSCINNSRAGRERTDGLKEPVTILVRANPTGKNLG